MSAFHLLDKRRSGILLHPTSLPGPRDHGDIGHQAYRFIEFLQSSGINVWQMLPLGPTHEDRSPYQCLSVHAGDPLLISMDWLKDRGWLTPRDMDKHSVNDELRTRSLDIACKRFLKLKDDSYEQYRRFTRQQSSWLDDYSLFVAIRTNLNQTGWMDWPADLRDREPDALGKAHKKLKKDIERIKFEQFVFFRQWHELKQYANERGIFLFGDMPIFVAHDSAEVWAHRELFTIDEHGQAITVAGVPPDYFSEQGQRWGNPLYHWDTMQQDGFSWWINRMQTQLDLFDVVRIDHFRGFEACWEIPADAETAIHGQWVKTPGYALLEKLYASFNPLPIIAEDLGTITDEVDALRTAFNIPGMKILQFAFSGDSSNPYLPHNHVEDCVVYTGTHDNDTTLSWFNALTPELQHLVKDYLGNSTEAMPWPIIRAAMASVARLCVFPMQDILALDKGHRMNVPGTQEGNWSWRFIWKQVPDDLASRLKYLTHLYGR